MESSGKNTMRIAMVAGEASGDLLASRLIKSLKNYYPDASFEGIAGKEMQQAGCQTLYSMDRLSVMGFTEVLSRLFELLKIRKSLTQRWLKNPPDLFIGVDAPDFNLKLEQKMYEAGIPTVHYVSPSVWAWRESRVNAMIASMDLMLTLFPFEVDFYSKYNLPAEFTGHPLADEIPLQSDKEEARKSLDLPLEPYILAVLPGSRMGEIKRIGPDFLRGIRALHKKYPDWVFVSPMISNKVKQEFLKLKKKIAADIPIHFIDGRSRVVMQASDQILMASGTAVLEGMLVGRPMVAAYRVSALTVRIIRLFDMIKSKYYTLPNNLADEYLVPELIQEDLSEESIVHEVEKQHAQSAKEREHMQHRFNEIHQQLSLNASEQAAKALYHLIEEGKGRDSSNETKKAVTP